MAETYRKNKIEKLIENLEIRRKVCEEMLITCETYPITCGSSKDEYLIQIELLNKIILYVRKEFNLS